MKQLTLIAFLIASCESKKTSFTNLDGVQVEVMVAGFPVNFSSNKEFTNGCEALFPTIKAAKVKGSTCTTTLITKDGSVFRMGIADVAYTISIKGDLFNVGTDDYYCYVDNNEITDLKKQSPITLTKLIFSKKKASRPSDLGQTDVEQVFSSEEICRYAI